MGGVDASRIVGLAMLAVVLVALWLLGAPLGLLALVGGLTLTSAFLPCGVGAQAACNLARKRYDREAWKADWSRNYLDDRQGRLSTRMRDRRRAAVDLPPDVIPDDVQEARAWMRTLAAIRRLPEN